MIKKMLSTILCLLLLGSVSASEISETENDDYLHSSSKYSKYEKDDDNKKSNPITPRHIALGALTIAVPVTILAALYKFLPSNNKALSMEPAELSQPIPYILPRTQIDTTLGTLDKYAWPQEVNKIPEYKQMMEHYGRMRAIWWHDNLCWFYASLLLFYYNEPLRRALIEFPAQEASELINNPESNLNDKDKACIKAMISLSKFFTALQGPPDANSPCVFKFSDGKDVELINVIKAAVSEIDTDGLYSDIFPNGIGKEGIEIAHPLLAVIKNVATNNCCGVNKTLIEWLRNYGVHLQNIEYKDDLMQRVFCLSSDDNVAIVFAHGHYFLRIRTVYQKYLFIDATVEHGYEFAPAHYNFSDKWSDYISSGEITY